MTALKYVTDRLQTPYANAMRRVRSTEYYARDWDAMVILDACRYDLFEIAVSGTSWRAALSAARSPGSATAEWLREEWRGRECHDCVYVTANPMYRTPWVPGHLDGVFHDVVDVWRDDWDDDAGTVRPEAVADAAAAAADRYPQKRLLVHFVQPHTPFIGEWAREHGVGTQKMEGLRRYANGTGLPNDTNPTWNRLENGDVSPRQLWIAYNENLLVALDEVRSLTADFRSAGRRTVVTSDHGNMFGERAWPFFRRFYGHPENRWTTGLRKVPWVALGAHTDRIDVTADPPREPEPPADTDDLDERLAALGYR